MNSPKWQNPGMAEPGWVICVMCADTNAAGLEQTLHSPGMASTSAPVVVMALRGEWPAAIRERFSDFPFLEWDAVQETASGNPLLACHHKLGQNPESADKDRIFVSAGTRLPPAWDERLCSAAYSDERLAAVFPLSDTLSAFALLRSETRTRPIDVEYVDALLLEHARGRTFESPIILSSAGYYRRAALDALPLATPLEDMARILRLTGWCLAGVDAVYVDDTDTDMGPLSQNVPEEELYQLTHAHPLTGLRHALNELVARNEPPKLPLRKAWRPVMLHIAHSWGGGLGRWVSDFIHADEMHEHLVLRSIGNWGTFGEKIALYDSAHMGVPLREWVLSVPIRATAVCHHEYRQALHEIIKDFRIEEIVVSSLIGHSIDALRTSLPTMVVAHDFHPFCPALNTYFGQVCTACDVNRLEECFDRNPYNQFFRNIQVQEWIRIREAWSNAVRSEHIQVIAPTAFVSTQMKSLIPAIADKTIQIIPHGVHPLLPGTASPSPPKGHRMKVLVLGRLSAQKGGDILLQALPGLKDFAEVYVLGCGEDCAKFMKFKHVHAVSHYEHRELRQKVEAIMPDVGLILSVVPETFSYTLSELWQLHIPPVAVCTGSFAERITENQTGFLIAPSAEAVVEALRQLHGDAHRLHAVRMHLQNHRQPTLDDMVEAYARLVPKRSCIAFRLSQLQRDERPPFVKENPPLYIDHQTPFRLVLIHFLGFMEGKVRHTPRLGALSRKLGVRLLSTISAFLHKG